MEGLQGGRAKNVLLAMVNSETAEIRNQAGGQAEVEIKRFMGVFMGFCCCKWQKLQSGMLIAQIAAGEFQKNIFQTGRPVECA